MTRTATQRTFVLGMGAQKAGTTALYRYLVRSPEFIRGTYKEYHVFDMLDVAEEPWTARNNVQEAEAVITALKNREPVNAKALHRLAMVGNPLVYYDSFAGLLHRDSARHVTADMTPAYALLPSERLAEIRREFERRGVRTVPVFVMRDPVDRLWSQLRMRGSLWTESNRGTAEQLILEKHTKPMYRLRSEYHHTIDALDEAFGDDSHFAFYEELFSPEPLASLCSKLGMAMHPVDPEARHNTTSVKASLPEAAERQVAHALTEVYVRVAARFPDVDLMALWPSARHVL